MALERSGCILKHHELSEDVPKGKERYHWHAYCFRKQTYIISILVENCLNLCGVDSDIINCNQQNGVIHRFVLNLTKLWEA